ncbi:hypothetical protein Y032_0104g3633 [Ancylostoma ceylanicum]|uniref:Uncharacterized protein n=1 Tax=Ancylostoma ceylanicum TaxID=53326 RepID=A0A016TFT2_9BILA|nr:hypothetical protein Y032_0104g3633 [Ancylostoma ceylanicum]
MILRQRYDWPYSSSYRRTRVKITHLDRLTRHEILNEKNARRSQGRKRVRLSCDCDATGSYSSSHRRTRVSRIL